MQHTLQEYQDAMSDFQPVIDHFAQTVYTQGLRDLIDAGPRGMEGEFDGVTLVSLYMAGRIMLSFARGDNDVTLLGDYFGDVDGNRLGLHAWTGPASMGVHLINAVCNAWVNGQKEFTGARVTLLDPAGIALVTTEPS
jgi:hypothetical protein